MLITGKRFATSRRFIIACEGSIITGISIYVLALRVVRLISEYVFVLRLVRLISECALLLRVVRLVFWHELLIQNLYYY